ncbi:hypothetical protein [Mucilaginibacter sp. BT774]|uniref:hypothetical protein n=1 Tax=Mucilaginibacter sp. BT774 TaxID=3062276 RepID=UPI0026773F32|nr:hypothetical protein [Mucilaginibacter sp. BT774]MDO3626774.1 hypothetical protein [Mucilaginibacter sp. BT774]
MQINGILVDIKRAFVHFLWFREQIVPGMISMDTKAAFVHFSLFVEQIARRLTPAEQKQRIRSFFPFFMDISPGG